MSELGEEANRRELLGFIFKALSTLVLLSFSPE